MSSKPTYLNDQLYDYVLKTSLREHPVLKELREETYKIPGAQMQISPDQGQFLQLLIQLISAVNTLEIGVFTGYSTLSVAMALPEQGRIIACDINPNTTQMAQHYWQKAGVDSKIDLKLAPALETLTTLKEQGYTNHFDFAFIDADKNNYLNYYELCLELVRPKGLIAIDNTLWHGDVLNPDHQDKDTIAIRTLNEKLHNDSRIELSLLTIGDGLTLAIKK